MTTGRELADIGEPKSPCIEQHLQSLIGRIHLRGRPTARRVTADEPRDQQVLQRERVTPSGQVQQGGQ